MHMNQDRALGGRPPASKGTGKSVCPVCIFDNISFYFLLVVIGQWAPVLCLYSPDGMCLRVENKTIQGDDVGRGEDEVVVLHGFSKEEADVDRTMKQIRKGSSYLIKSTRAVNFFLPFHFVVVRSWAVDVPQSRVCDLGPAAPLHRLLRS